MKLTPMMRQYYELKEQYPDSILFFRLGDFYEMFGDDAKLASKVLEIALTSREAGPQGRVPMCGVPHHAAEGYIEKLVRSGYRVALCEQLEDPREAKGVVKRDVVRVITPGTFIEGQLDAEENQFLAALAWEGRTIGLASLDMSTGEFMTVSLGQGTGGSLESELARLQPAEILVTADWDDLAAVRSIAEKLGALVTEVKERQDSLAAASQVLLSHFDVSSLSAFGLTSSAEILAAALALQYVQDTQRAVLSHIRAVQSCTLDQYLQIDAHSRDNLELVKTVRDGKKKGSLLGVLDNTVTGMGARQLRSFLERPLLDLEAIEARHDAVEALLEQTALRLDLKDLLGEVHDLERLLGRLVAGSGNARDLKALANSLEKIPSIKELFSQETSPLLTDLAAQLDPLTEFTELVGRAIVDEPAITLRDGNLIRDGYNSELDALRQASKGGKS